MRVIYSLFLLAIVSFLMKGISASQESLFTQTEMQEINRRLRSIGTM